ncbi:hypothetical protein LJB42_002315 [Komagataella kurtzmanii]|nr:hypothetical protein LJB42_002315 [Komagataella kurtzmanii]
MSQFLGSTVLLVLKNNKRFQGKIDAVDNKVASLSSVVDLNTETRQSIPDQKIQGRDIAKLEVLSLCDKVLKNNESKKNKNKKKSKAKKDDNDIAWNGDDKLNEEFDFQSNLDKFDKESVFRELSAQDNIDPNLRLAGHNKKVNYDHNEMVVKKEADTWDNQQSIPTPIAPSRSSTSTFSHLQRQPSIRQPGFGIHLTDGANLLPSCSPVQLLEMERITVDEYKVPIETLLENVAINVSSIVIKSLGGYARFDQTNHNLPPLILFLVGNNRSGARVLSVGRRLVNIGARCVAILTNTNSDELIDSVKRQSTIFTKFGGRLVYNINQLTMLLDSLQSPLEFVVDGLQGYDNHLDDLFGVELTTSNSLIEWVNQQYVNVLSLDIPSGLEPSSAHINSENAFLQSKFIVSVGLPLNGVLNAYKEGGVLTPGDCIHYLVDLSVPRAIFKKGSLRKFDRDWFEDKGFIELFIKQTI